VVTKQKTYIPVIHTNNMEKVGKAYGFFACDKSKREIKRSLPKICKHAKVDYRLWLSSIEDMKVSKNDEELSDVVRYAEEEGMDYVLQSIHPGKTNIEAAGDITDTLNQAYQSPLYEDGGSFNGMAAYEENGRYVVL